MIHGCRIGRGSIVEPGAIVCDGSAVGAESVVRAGACVKQRDRFGDRSILDGFPVRLAGTLTGPPPMPGWAFPGTQSQLSAECNDDRTGREEAMVHGYCGRWSARRSPVRAASR